MDQEKTVVIQPEDEDFGTVLDAAVRHAITRRSVIPAAVIRFTTPLLPSVDRHTLQSLDEFLTESLFISKSGVPNPNHDLWMEFREAVRTERTKRGETLYVSWAARKKEYPFQDVSE